MFLLSNTLLQRAVRNGREVASISTTTTHKLLSTFPRHHSAQHPDESSEVFFPPNTTVLFFSTVLPEPAASAAGVRTAFMLEKLVKTAGVSSVHYATASHKQTQQSWLQEHGIHFHHVPPNRTNMIQEFVSKIKTKNVMVVFDRFYAEEMYSFHVHKCIPEAVLVLDMQDMHSLRWARQRAVKQSDAQITHHDYLANLPLDVKPDVHDDRVLRELASIYRSDLSLVCSPAEMNLLQHHLKVPSEKLCLAPCFGEPMNAHKQVSFQDRKDFVFCGGFRHEPNVDAVRQLKRLWLEIRQHPEMKSHNVNVHIYGSYCSSHLKSELHDETNGFLVQGFERSLSRMLADKRVLLAPLRFGAGIKGKIVDAWKWGVPVATTSMGSEGIDKGTDWGGAIAQNDADFVENAVRLYTKQEDWTRAHTAMPKLLDSLCGNKVWNRVATQLSKVVEHREVRRDRDFVRGLMWHQTLRSTEYLSKYIELKEKGEDRV